MGHYFPDAALTHHRRNANRSLIGIIEEFPVSLKKALYAAAKTGYVKSGTWNGCAFNKAGSEIGVKVRNIKTAALTFGIKEDIAGRFILKWDSMRLGAAARANFLMEVLEDIGITVPPEHYKNVRLVGDEKTAVFDMTVYKSSQTEFIEELATAETVEDLGITQEEIDEASDLLLALQLQPS